MSEIRTRLQGGTPFFPNMLNNGSVEVCLKEDVDKVIAEKDNELRHQKYKRCLAMAYVEWLKQIILCNYTQSFIYRRAARREHKWKEMAQKFKEAK